jgi:hypothetical protein
VVGAAWMAGGVMQVRDNLDIIGSLSHRGQGRHDGSPERRHLARRAS